MARYPFEYIVIHRDTCSLTFGEGSCSASLGDGTQEKCFNTIATCRALDSYTPTTVEDYFVQQENALVPPSRIQFPGGRTMRSYPFLVSVSHKPARINPVGVTQGSSTLGTRAEITCKLMDVISDDFYQDKYYNERQSGEAREDNEGYEPNDRGTFFTKYFARNQYLWGRKIEWVTGHIDDEGGLHSITRREYVIQSVSGPTNNGEITIQAQDILCLTNYKEAQIPKPSEGQLASGINTSEKTIRLSPAGVGEDYPSKGTIRIGDEMIYYSSKSGDNLNADGRGQYSTSSSSHSQGDTVQLCFFVGHGGVSKKRPNDVIEDVLSNYTTIPNSYLDTSQWANEVDTHDWLKHEYDTVISQPTSVSRVIDDIATQMQFFPFYSERDNKIRIKAISPEFEKSSVNTSLDDDRNLLSDSVEMKKRNDQAITRAYVYHDIKSRAHKIDDKDSYKSVQVWVSEEEEGEDRKRHGSAMDIFGYWLSSSQADLLGQNLLQQFSKAPTELSIEVDAKDRGLAQADFVRIQTRQYVNEFGIPRPFIGQVYSVEEDPRKRRWSYTAVEYQQVDLGGGSGQFIVPIPSDAKNVNLMDEFNNLYPAVTPESGEEVTFIIRSGVLITSTSTSKPALLVNPSFASGVEVTVEIESGSEIIGVGGKGGSSKNVNAKSSGSARIYGGSPNGKKGGDAIHFTKSFDTFLNEGFIAGGGGGGGAGQCGADTSHHAKVPALVGGGGGGGAGVSAGSGGSVGSYNSSGAGGKGVNDSPGKKGKSGSKTTGGSGGGPGPKLSNPTFSGLRAPSGGSGGNLGQSGSSGGSVSHVNNIPDYVAGKGSGGAAGKAITGKSKAGTYTNNGTIKGSVS